MRTYTLILTTRYANTPNLAVDFLEANETVILDLPL